MKKLTFLTSGKINYFLPGKSLYQSIRKTSLGEEFPSLEKTEEKEFKKLTNRLKKPVKIISAPSAQCKETTEILTRMISVPVFFDDKLLPLKFEIKNLISEEEFNSLGNKAFDLLRERFLEIFFEDKLLESNKEIKKRFIEFKEENAIYVSHAFLIKLFEVYSKIGDKMYKDKAMLFKEFNPKRPPYKRLKIVTINL